MKTILVTDKHWYWKLWHTAVRFCKEQTVRTVICHISLTSQRARASQFNRSWWCNRTCYSTGNKLKWKKAREDTPSALASREINDKAQIDNLRFFDSIDHWDGCTTRQLADWIAINFVPRTRARFRPKGPQLLGNRFSELYALHAVDKLVVAIS